MGITDKVVEKVTEKGFNLVEKYLVEANKAPKNNVEACIKYLRVAQMAIDGLEREVDEILIESKLVALFDWEKRAELYRRIEQYVNVDKLRPLLAKTIDGMKASLRFAQEDAESYFQWPGRRLRKEDAADTLSNLVDKASQYLESLSGVMALSPENYIGPSGVNMEELIEIRRLLVLNEGELEEKDRRNQIIKLAETCQAKRHKRGLNIVSQASGAMHQLSIAFGIDVEIKDA